MQTDKKIKVEAGKVSSLLTGYVPTSNHKYNDWIASHFPDKDSAYMKCHEAVLAMTATFPELTAVKGHIYEGLNYRAHWWCVTPSGEIIDPTAHQWEYGVMDYDPWKGEEPLGKCLNCGEYTYKSNGGQMCLCADCLDTLSLETSC